MHVSFSLPCGLRFRGAGAGPGLGGRFDASAHAAVERVIDGGAVKMRVPIRIDQELLVSVRVADIDASELFRPKCPAEQIRARAAKDFVAAFLVGGEAALLDVRRGK